ncbi:NYN domain-containing protein [Parachlamydia acanthamoebae]|uniref:NYN domain-containing protein n=1 Tax=Parachlamydia acanthamoebae TaxID=83552 RepID=UPI0007507413|nr:NYN domain-containing protein [Parachlamydia acanthamoebae]
MHYFIDGYNLMFRVLRVGDNLALQREKIIEDLHSKIAALNLNVTLVFDAQYQLGETSRTHYKQLEIIFSSTGETADEFIISELKIRKSPFQCTVVTSDKKLAWLSRLQAAKTETVEEFIGWLNKRYANRGRRRILPRLQLEKKQITPPKKVPTEPLPAVQAEDCFSYYLNAFQKNLEKLIAENPPKRKKASLKKDKQIQEEQVRLESDYSRWERLFNERLKEDQKE